MKWTNYKNLYIKILYLLVEFNKIKYFGNTQIIALFVKNINYFKLKLVLQMTYNEYITLLIFLQYPIRIFNKKHFNNFYNKFMKTKIKT